MKYTYPLLALLTITSVNAQGLYNTSGDSTYSDESLFQITAGARVGFDDNVNPINSENTGVKTDSLYIGANVRAAYSEKRSNAYLGFSADLGAIHYLDDIRDDSTVPTFNAGLNLGYSVNQRIKLTSNNYLTFGLEPDYERGIAQDRRAGEYFAYSSYNTIGINWTNRLATKHSIAFTGTEYDNGASYSRITLGSEIRYKLNDRTILKAGGNYGLGENSDNISYYGGFEHSFSDRTGIDVVVGGNTVDRDNGYSKSGFYGSATMTHAASDRLSLSGYARYGLDDTFVSLFLDDYNAAAVFSARTNLRLGFKADYKVSERIGFYGGVSIVNSEYHDGAAQNSTGIGSVDDASTFIYNVNAGLKYGFNDNLSAVLNYNHTGSMSDDSSPYEYDRNRYSAGLEYKF